MHLRHARADELELLTDLCLRSKAVWGYGPAFMEACRGELTLTPGDLRTTEIQVAESGAKVIGVAQVTTHGSIAQLEKLFVEPAVMRSGAGRALFDWAKQVAAQHGATAMIIDADPGAAEFYRRMGAVDDGVAPSGSIPGRYLPRLKLKL